MSVNLSRLKIRVSQVLGTNSTIGLTDPKVNQQVRHGNREFWVVSAGTGALNHYGLVGLSLASGGTPLQQKAYPHDLEILASGIDNASIGTAGTAAYFGWPNQPGDVVFGDMGVFPPPTGVPHANPIVAGEYQGGDGNQHTITYGPYTD